MTDPLLTIEDATREFRVSPKTIRRRLSAGEIDGAYKRPGNRGPEWVMPRGSLAAVGFVPRAEAAAAELPDAAEERAAYWERRAVDAEAALTAATAAHRQEPTTSSRLGRLGWVLVVATIIIGLLTASVVFLRGDDESTPDAAPGAVALAWTLLEDRTEVGDDIGVAGSTRTDALPDGRSAVTMPDRGWPDGPGPRFVVAISASDGPVPPAVELLRRDAEVVLRAPHAGQVVEVFDRGRAAIEASTEAAPDPVEPVEDPAPAAPPADDGQPSAAPPVEVDPAPSDPPGQGAPTDAPPAQEPSPTDAPVADGEAAVQAGTAVVADGESFWSIAEDVIAADGGDVDEAAVTAYWSALLVANADQLVDPGNPDLLHVGQTLTMPPLP